MKFITVSGPPSAGKTAVILQAIKAMQQQNMQVGVVKFDCLATDDDKVYAKYGIPVRTGLAGPLCPDHYFVSNIEECLEWGRSQKLDMLISESAGLCNRCSPHIEKITAVCVIDNLSGIGTPKKIGPMLKTADIVIITKGDIVSQAAREVFASRVAQVNPAALIMHINGITGQGAYELSTILTASSTPDNLQEMGLRYSMPSALCSYCLGEKRIGKQYQLGNVRKIQLDDPPGDTP
jgi:Ni2+-binding GTPase involved in maturation of urease and hydrogenase